MIVNPDHMSQAGVDDTLTLLESRQYSGVISPHGWMDPGNWPRLWKLGGVAFPGHSAAADYVKEWQKYRPRRRRTPSAGATAPTSAGSRTSPTRAPTAPASATRSRATTARSPSTASAPASGRSTTARRASPTTACTPTGSTTCAGSAGRARQGHVERRRGLPRDVGARRRDPHARRAPTPITRSQPGASARSASAATGTTLLRRAGQPQQRTRAWSWCVAGKLNHNAADVAELSRAGKVELVGSTARGRSAGGVLVGAPARRVRTARSAGGGVRFRATRRGAWVYAVRGGRVRAVAVASRDLARSPSALRVAVGGCWPRRRPPAPQSLTPAQPQPAAGARLTGRTIAGTSDPKLNAALVMLCSLQVTGALPPGSGAVR